MAGEMQVTVIGNLAGDPELRFTASGHAVANLTIAQTPRSFDKQSNQWKDDETLWVRASVWREEAEHVAETLQKGMRVIAHGRLQARSFEDKKTGQTRTNWELAVDEIGPSLKWATAQVNRNPQGGQAAPQTQQQPQAQAQSQGGWGAQPVPPVAGNAWGGQQQGGNPPF